VFIIGYLFQVHSFIWHLDFGPLNLQVVEVFFIVQVLWLTFDLLIICRLLSMKDSVQNQQFKQSQ